MGKRRNVLGYETTRLSTKADHTSNSQYDDGRRRLPKADGNPTNGGTPP
jgi:hypothetical protein